MTGEAFLDLCALIALALLMLAMLVTIVRIIIGPTLADRVLALDLLTILGAGMIAAIAIRTGFHLYLDVAIALGLMGFLSTVAFARYILSRKDHSQMRDPAP